mmetsp:Transcript_36440/g.66759  ORF Transcript_36440/g.66759 Transcript_36440/m.66759 type:complete len:208 (-) Transcript_36440:150-773(-)
MPSEGVTFDSLAAEAQLLVEAAGRVLEKTTYPFHGTVESRTSCAVTALEHTFCKQRVPQRTIAAALSGEISNVNDEVVSSIGVLWREGWRCERDVAMHSLRFIRTVHHGSPGPSGEIVGLRSYVDFAFVLGQWFMQQGNGSVAEAAEFECWRTPKRTRTQVKRVRAEVHGDDKGLQAEMDVAQPRKLSRFFSIPERKEVDTSLEELS